MSAHEPKDDPRISRRALLEGAGALGLSAASGLWLGPVRALAAPGTRAHSAAQPQPSGHLIANYLPSQPTGWPPEQGHIRNGVGVTIGGHVASLPFTLGGAAYEVSLLGSGQPGATADPIYEPEPSDPTIDFKATLQKAWSAYYTFNYTGGFSGASAISVQSYSVEVTEPTADRPNLGYGCDVFCVYEPDPASGDPPITADLRWIEVSNSGGRSSTEFRQRACPYYFPGGLTSVYGKPACSFYGAPAGGIGVKPPHPGTSPDTGAGPALSQQTLLETFLANDTGRKDHSGRGIIDIYGGIKWGWQIQAAQS
jgi:hypothetical protein